MKKATSRLFVSFLYLVFTIFCVVSPSFALSSCPQPQDMMAHPKDPAWDNRVCINKLVNYVYSLPQSQRTQLANTYGKSLTKAAEIMRNRTERLRRANDQAYEQWENTYNSFAHCFGTASGMVEWNGYAYVPVKGQTRSPVEEQIQKGIQSQVSRETQMEVLPGWPRSEVWDKLAKASKHVPDLQGLLNSMLKNVKAGADLTPFLELIIREGKSDPESSNYISNDVMNMAFMLYAYSIPANQADKILKYTHSNYVPRVRWAAASAVAYFAKDTKKGTKLVPNNPLGRLILTDDQREEVLPIFWAVFDGSKTNLSRMVVQYYLSRIYGNVNWMALNIPDPSSSSTHSAVFGPMNLVLAPSMVEMLTAEVGASLPSAMEVLSVSLAAPATTATGVAVLGNVPMVVLGMALDDAFTPMYRIAFEQKLRESLHIEKQSAAPAQAETDAAVSPRQVAYENAAQSHVQTQTRARSAAQTSSPTWIAAERITSEIPAGYGIEVLPASWMLNSDAVDVIDNQAISKAETQSAAKTEEGPQTCSFQYVDAGALPENLIKSLIKTKSVLLADAETATAWERFVENCSPLPEEQCPQEVAQLKHIKSLSKSFYASGVTQKTQGDRRLNLYVRAVYRQAHGGWIAAVEYPKVGAQALDNLLSFVERTFFRVSEGEMSFGQRIMNLISGGHFREKIGMFLFRDGLHGPEGKDLFGMGKSGYMKQRDDGLFKHFHVEHLCGYNSRSSAKQVCTPGSAAIAGEKYICNLAFYYCADPQNLATCASRLMPD